MAKAQKSCGTSNTKVEIKNMLNFLGNAQKDAYTAHSW